MNPQAYANWQMLLEALKGTAPARFASSARNAILPEKLSDVATGPAYALRHPIDSASMLGGAMQDASQANFEKMYGADNPFEVVGYGAAGAIPMIGPMAAHAGEQIGSGDVAGGLGTATAMLAPTLLGAKGKPAPVPLDAGGLGRRGFLGKLATAGAGAVAGGELLKAVPEAVGSGTAAASAAAPTVRIFVKGVPLDIPLSALEGMPSSMKLESSLANDARQGPPKVYMQDGQYFMEAHGLEPPKVVRGTLDYSHPNPFFSPYSAEYMRLNKEDLVASAFDRRGYDHINKVYPRNTYRGPAQGLLQQFDPSKHVIVEAGFDSLKGRRVANLNPETTKKIFPLDKLVDGVDYRTIGLSEHGIDPTSFKGTPVDALPYDEFRKITKAEWDPRTDFNSRRVLNENSSPIAKQLAERQLQREKLTKDLRERKNSRIEEIKKEFRKELKKKREAAKKSKGKPAE